MTKETKAAEPTPLEVLTERIVKAVPEIMELKAGCMAIERYTAAQFDFDGHYWTSTRNQNVRKISEDFNAEDIQGRPIALEDVLRALCQQGMHTKIGDWKACGTINEILAFYSGNGKALFNWKLGLPLSKQSPETIEFLSSLIA